MALEYRTKANYDDEWGEWKLLSIPNELAFSNWYVPKFFQFRELRSPTVYEHMYHGSATTSDVGLLRGAIRHLEGRVDKLERLRYVVTVDPRAGT